MSHDRVTTKPRLFTPPLATEPAASTAAPASTATPAPPKPAAPYPKHPPRHARRHWISIFAMWLAMATCVSAQPSDEGLAFRAAGGWQPALAMDTSVEMQIHGLIAEVTVRQQFVNDDRHWQEGRYLLPLPAEAAVGRLRVRIGERLIEGEVREKEAAQQVFAAAAAQGQTAALIEQARPNLFRTALTNIGPNERIEVEIAYWQTITYRDGAFSISLPLTLTPRYASPTIALASDEHDALTPDRSKRAALGLEPSVSLSIDLDAGVPLAGIDSATHAISVTHKVGYARIELAEQVEPADRDFELRWQPQPSAQPQRAVFSEEIDGEHFALLMLLPPTQRVAALPREMILVIDTSGSMHGAAMSQAQAALDSALQRLRPDDRFNVIRFSNITEALYPEPMAVSASSIARARRFVADLNAEGGTEMAPALQQAFAGAPPDSMVRQVVLATDAAIHNEAALLSLIETTRNEARVFPVGIGSAPNSHFLRRAAELGRGTEVVIRDILDVNQQMGQLFARLDRPVLREVRVTWPNANEVYPPQLPDLYAGEPLLVVARLPVLQGEVRIDGLARSQSWTSTLRLDPLQVIQAEGVGRLWGRARIAALEDAMRAGLGEFEGRSLIIETALQHGLASRFTSLVAVEKTPRRAPDAALNATAIPNAAPADSLAFAQGSTNARSQLGLALTLLLMAAAVLRRREPVRAPGVA